MNKIVSLLLVISILLATTLTVQGLQNEKMLLDSDFSDASELLFSTSAPASTAIKDGSFLFNSGGQNMLYGKPLLNGVSVQDFSWQFTYTPTACYWNTDRFCFHSDGTDEGSALLLNIIGSGNANGKNNISIIQRIAGEYTELVSATVPLATNIAYTIRIICKGQDVLVYYWVDGTNIPEKPTLTVKCTNPSVQSGAFVLQGFQSDYALDDMRIYNYADGKQNEVYLAPLPDNVRLFNYNFNGMRGKTDFPFVMTNSLKYWQNTLMVSTPAGLAVDSKNIVGDYSLTDLCWQFDFRDFNEWSVNRFVIHSIDGSIDNCIYLLVLGSLAKSLDDPAFVNDSKHSAIRLIQVIDGKMEIIGKYDENMKKGKAYNLMISSKDNHIDIFFGDKRTGKSKSIISAKANDKLSFGTTFISGYQMSMWIDNMSISNCPYPSTNDFKGSLFAIKK